MPAPAPPRAQRDRAGGTPARAVRSNSRSGTKKWCRDRVTASGVDSVSFAWRPRGELAIDGLLAQPHRGAAQGGVVLNDRLACGARVLGWPAHGIIAVEGRLGALLAGDEGNHELVRASRCARGAEAAREAVAAMLGVDPGERAEVRRVDLAAELVLDRPAEGFEVLEVHSGMCPPRAQITVHRADDGRPMTVYVRTAARGEVRSRAYDKGRESGSHEPGLRLRIEAQHRPRKSQRYTPATYAELDHQAEYSRTMRHYLKERHVVAAGPDGAVEQLLGQVARDELTIARAERLAGSVQFLRAAGRAAYHEPTLSGKENNRRSARRLKSLRDAGISLSAELPADAELPVGELLALAVERFKA
jgi:hypothetical protein